MTFRLGVLVGLLAGILLASLFSKRQPRIPAQPVDIDRFNMAEMDNRFREYDAAFNLERKHGKQP